MNLFVGSGSNCTTILTIFCQTQKIMIASKFQYWAKWDVFQAIFVHSRYYFECFHILEVMQRPVYKLVVTTQKTFIFAKTTLVSVKFLIPLPLSYYFTFAFLVKREPKTFLSFVVSWEWTTSRSINLGSMLLPYLQCVPKMS